MINLTFEVYFYTIRVDIYDGFAIINILQKLNIYILKFNKLRYCICVIVLISLDK